LTSTGNLLNLTRTDVRKTTGEAAMRPGLLATLLFACAASPLAAMAQTAGSFPSQPIRLVVPYPPGGSADVLSRTLGKQIAEDLGQNVIIENKPGAGTAIGSKYVAGSPADGYTLLMGTVSSHAMTPLINANAGYDPLKDFAPVAPVAEIPFAMLLNQSVPAKSLEEFLALAKQNPGKFTYASAGVGTSNHLAGELLNSMAGIQMVHVPYKGSAPALADLLGGQVDVMFDLLMTAVKHVDSGKVRAVAVTSGKPSDLLKDVPTFVQSGLPDYVVSAWFGIFAPAGTPADVVNRLNQAVVKATQASDTRRQLEGMGAAPLASGSTAFAGFVRDEHAKWSKVISETKLTGKP
jgi:tripartite-type tricarboxylate transporter receptor subunit TctC